MKLRVGEIYKVTNKEGGRDAFCSAAYPWDGAAVLVRVDAEYRFYYLVTVMPHNHRPFCFGRSHPYKVTLDKRDLKAGDIIVKGRKRA